MKKPGVVAFDTETALISPGLQAPPVACLQWARRRGSEIELGIVDPDEGARLVRRWVEDDGLTLVGHNVAFDAVVMCAHDPALLPVFFRAYERGQVVCTLLSEQLHDLALGVFEGPGKRYGLGALASLLLGIDLDKDEATSWRYRYGALVGTGPATWPAAAREYALEDARATLLLREDQERRGLSPDAEAQSRAAFAFRLMQTWGMRTDGERVSELRRQLDDEYQTLFSRLREAGILRANGTQNMDVTRKLLVAGYPGTAPTTPTGAVSTAAEVLERCSDERVRDLVDYKKNQKVRTTFLPVVERGVNEPVCPQINPLVKNGRSSYRDPNLQNLPRDGGIRECFVPRPGRLFVDVDYDTLEIRTLAQVLYTLLGGRTLRDAYQQDPDFDPHTRLAAQILGLSYDEALGLKRSGHKRVRDMRQMAKAANFGYPGGMAARTFVDYAAKSYDMEITPSKATRLREDWLASVPEMRRYFAMISAATDNGRLGQFKQLFSNRRRGGMYYTDMANGYWSGLAADGAKHALFSISRACYVDERSPLFGARPVVYIHDEFILEADEEAAPDVGEELARVAMEAMEKFTPDVPSRASPCLMRRWYKGAETVRDADGRLVPWEPS